MVIDCGMTMRNVMIGAGDQDIFLLFSRWLFTKWERPAATTLAIFNFTTSTVIKIAR